MKKCLRFFNFNISNITKFGQIFLAMITTWATLQNWMGETLI
jgi:hypothetical protein